MVGVVTFALALSAGQTATEFITTTATGEHAEFQNPDHDFPCRIRYTREGTDILITQIDDGTEMSRIDFAYKRSRCDGA